ncbi:MAG: MBL fold metallo-hydrolase, partial [Desulfuromonadales bacterium]|nr:MBL fold metallo-hydrolase [Desulfuromonadales bacterium]
DLSGVPIQIGGIDVDAILLSHPNGGFGYRLTEDDKVFVFLTDNELEFEHPEGKSYVDYLEFSRGADLLIHDAEYTDKEYETRTRGWGHSRYRKALQLAMEAGVKQFGIFHHNQDRTDAEIDAIVADCHEIIARTGSKMICYAVAQDQEIVIR